MVALVKGAIAAAIRRAVEDEREAIAVLFDERAELHRKAGSSHTLIAMAVDNAAMIRARGGR